MNIRALVYDKRRNKIISSIYTLSAQNVTYIRLHFVTKVWK